MASIRDRNATRGAGARTNGGSQGRDAVVEMTVAQIEKQHGKGSIIRMGDMGPLPGIETISTGSLALDLALGVCGLPRGRIVEIYGPEGSGKTTVSLHVIAEAQKAGGLVAFIDAEHALDPAYAKALGVNIDDLLVSQPDTGEQALEITDTLTRSGALDVIVIDSVAALVPRAELEGEMGDSHVGLQARLMSQALRKLTGNVSRTRTVLIFINQIREKIGVMFGSNDHPRRAGSQVLLVGPARRQTHRLAQGRGRDRRVPGEGQGRQEQGERTVQEGRVRHPVRNRDIEGRKSAGRRHRPRHRAEVGSVVHLR